jgi:hypothetical protein
MTRSDDGDPRVDGLSGRLDGLSGVQETPEDEEEVIRQQREAQLIGVIEADHDQARYLKKRVVPLVFFILGILMGTFLGLLMLLIYNYGWVAGFLGGPHKAAEAAVVPVAFWALLSSLLFSITTLTVALLIGVFRVPKSSIVETLLAHGGRAAVGS